ncbi:uncharacterized protein MAM_02839 [Metarhizium album ARSEF 1941]|uniref:Uncharacterized protein n=1 Tax=Metarhizium album (strain ARSEF 1941) TaxID=1081103 RepID=A0A0B2WSU4_METAS|nr:uncharacterized protein MAM_02839 [Metarhizium album ARSEF 1941]KHN99141.1 hypothetical protein MAM_02839 [Metarhizium album ARSEF 1941]
MARFASPALGCQLRLVEVEMDAAKETYDPRHFNEPLELSLEGQRSLGSDCGVLSLLITTGTRQMLSLRLNDLLSHPRGTEGMISVDRGNHRLCVNLPNRNHTLRVWFAEERDFLISVCILRKSGFKIEDSKIIQHRGIGTAATNTSTDPKFELAKASSANQTSPFSTTSLTVLTAQAKSLCHDDPLSFPRRKPWGENIFDEVLESLQRLSEDSKSRNVAEGDPLLESLGSHDLSYLNPYNAFSIKRKAILNQPNVGSPLKNMVDQEQQHQSESKRLKTTYTAPEPQPRHSHRYFTRSFSSSKSEAQKKTELRFPSSSLKVQRNASASTGGIFSDSTRGTFSASSDSSPIATLQQIMPRRRNLPFSTLVKSTHEKLRPASHAAEIDPGRESVTPPRARDKTQLSKGRLASPETTIILTPLASLDNVDKESCKIFDQYEKDIARGRDQGQSAVFYLERLHIARSSFWLNELRKIGKSDGETITSIQYVANRAHAMN